LRLDTHSSDVLESPVVQSFYTCFASLSDMTLSESVQRHHSGTLSFKRDQLFTFNHSRPPSRPVRKTLFAQRLWRPGRDRAKPRTTRGRSNGDNVNKHHAHTSPWRVGWLNVRSLSNTRKPCYRKEKRAMRPVYGYPEKFWESLAMPTATFPEIVNGLLL